MSTILLIRHKVKPGMNDRYESWLKKIIPVAASFAGHQGVHVIRPGQHNNEFVVVIRFSSAKEAADWTESPSRRELVAEITDAIHGDQTEIKSGIEFWFTPPDEKRPPAWKQWLITTAVIAPLTMIIPTLYRPLFKVVPALGVFGVSHALIAATIVALVTFLIMPRLVKALYPWLYKEKADAAINFK